MRDTLTAWIVYSRLTLPSDMTIAARKWRGEWYVNGGESEALGHLRWITLKKRLNTNYSYDGASVVLLSSDADYGELENQELALSVPSEEERAEIMAVLIGMGVSGFTFWEGE